MSDRAPDTSNEQRKALEADLRRVLRALGPYLADLVLIGGWVPYLHRRYGGIERWDAWLSFTSELDVLVATGRLDARERPPLADLLRQASLKMIPVATEMTALHTSTAGSMRTTARCSSAGGRSVTLIFSVSHATAIPSIPPASARSTLSVSIWRASLQRPAPSATRTGSSRRLAAARASSGFATLAHAM